MIRAGQPECFKTAHTLVSNQYVLHGFIKCMSHVELTRDVGRGNHNGVRLFIGIRLGMKISALFPFFVQPFFNRRRVVGFGHFVGCSCGVCNSLRVFNALIAAMIAHFKYLRKIKSHLSSSKDERCARGTTFVEHSGRSVRAIIKNRKSQHRMPNECVPLESP